MTLLIIASRVVEESPLIQVNSYYPFGMVSRTWLREGEIQNANLFQGKELISQTGWHDFGSRMYWADLGRWFSTDPQKQFSSPYVGMGNSPLMGTDPDGEFFWFAAIGALVGGYAGAAIQQGTMDPTQWESDWYKGAITGAFIGAGAGLGLAAALGPGSVSGITVGNSTLATAELTKAWGITSTAIQGANVNMALTALGGGNLDNVYKSGLVGATSGLFASTGGFGMINAWGATNKAAQFAGRQLYQAIGTAGTSIGNNWAAGRDLLSSVTIGVGPVNLTFGEGQQLVQLGNNLGNAAVNAIGLANLAAGKIVRDASGNIISNTRGRLQFDWGHLAPVYSKGFIDKRFLGAWGAHAVLSPSDMIRDGVLPHELHHVWQSRALGDVFLLNYAAQGIFPLLMGRSPILEGNYFEAQAYKRLWFN